MDDEIENNERVQDLTRQYWRGILKDPDEDDSGCDGGKNDADKSDGKIYFVTSTGEPLATFNTAFDDNFLPPIALTPGGYVLLSHLPMKKDSKGVWHDLRCDRYDQQLQTPKWYGKRVRVVALPLDPSPITISVITVPEQRVEPTEFGLHPKTTLRCIEGYVKMPRNYAVDTLNGCPYLRYETLEKYADAHNHVNIRLVKKTRDYIRFVFRGTGHVYDERLFFICPDFYEEAQSNDQVLVDHRSILKSLECASHLPLFLGLDVSNLSLSMERQKVMDDGWDFMAYIITLGANVPLFPSRLSNTLVTKK